MSTLTLNKTPISIETDSALVDVSTKPVSMFDPATLPLSQNFSDSAGVIANSS